jgi:hypothetical protein
MIYYLMEECAVGVAHISAIGGLRRVGAPIDG